MITYPCYVIIHIDGAIYTVASSLDEALDDYQCWEDPAPLYRIPGEESEQYEGTFRECLGYPVLTTADLKWDLEDCALPNRCLTDGWLTLYEIHDEDGLSLVGGRDEVQAAKIKWEGEEPITGHTTPATLEAAQ